jgi:tRNA (uracil-5-)-methyltransferase
MLSYPVQLELKRTVVIKAFQNFSGDSTRNLSLLKMNQYFLGLPESSLPPIHPTIASPLQYGYRTKITPHFEAPPKKFRRPNDASTHVKEKPDWLKIGFNRIGQRHVMDIEVPIVTFVIWFKTEHTIRNALLRRQF